MAPAPRVTHHCRPHGGLRVDRALFTWSRIPGHANPPYERGMNAQRTINFTLNGLAVTASVAPHHNLIELLQGHFGLTGAREACGQGLCGCCTVLVNGRAVSGCLYLASFVDGADVATIEGFDASYQLTPEQEAFIETGAFQCGYCTSGFII